MKRLFASLVIISCLVSFPLLAKQISGQLPNHIWVNAEYHVPDDGKPTILLIHPLLQTNQFSTIAHLTDALVDEGYGVLAPNLSLGISNRHFSMACEAIHTQSLTEDIKEARFWLDWLSENGQSTVIGMGHSTGALQIMNYAETDRFASMILISLTPFMSEGFASINPEQLAHARQSKAQGYADGLGRFQLSYCPEYVTPRDIYLDITQWDADKICHHLQGLDVPVDIILSDSNYQLSKHWIATLKNPLINIYSIKGANHFFSGSEEVDLHDKVLHLLESKQ